jgi:hypothetical protein
METALFIVAFAAGSIVAGVIQYCIDKAVG